MTPTVGRTVLYTLSDEDATYIANRRGTNPLMMWTPGTQPHHGVKAVAGDVLPMLIVRVLDGGTVNGQVFLDGNDVLWRQNVEQGDGAGKWHETA